MTVATYIYKDFEDANSSSFKFRESCARFGYGIHNVSENGKEVTLNEILRRLYEYAKELHPDDLFMYADGADTFFVRKINPREDRILYMTEKGLWPDTQEMLGHWKRHFQNYQPTSPWKYINGGAWVGPAGLAVKFFEDTGLHKYGPMPAHNSQKAQAMAYIQWKEAGNPIELDWNCTELQTIGFEEKGDFETDGLVYNTITRTYPALLHGNGRTPMQWVYDAVNQDHAHSAKSNAAPLAT